MLGRLSLIAICAVALLCLVINAARAQRIPVQTQLAFGVSRYIDYVSGRFPTDEVLENQREINAIQDQGRGSEGFCTQDGLLFCGSNLYSRMRVSLTESESADDRHNFTRGDGILTAHCVDGNINYRPSDYDRDI